MKIKKSTRKKVKKVAKRVKRTVNRYATKIGLRRKKNPEQIDYNDYELDNTWNDAERMWTCKECGGRPSKSTNVSLERPQYVRHRDDCKTKRKQALNTPKKNPSFREGVYYSILTKKGDVFKGKLDEADIKDSTGARFVVLLDRFGDEIYIQHDNIKDYKPITEFEYIRTFYDRPKKY